MVKTAAASAEEPEPKPISVYQWLGCSQPFTITAGTVTTTTQNLTFGVTIANWPPLLNPPPYPMQGNGNGWWT